MGMLVGGVGGVNLAAAVGRQAALHGSGDVHSSEGLQRLLLSGSLYPSGRVTEGTVNHNMNHLLPIPLQA